MKKVIAGAIIIAACGAYVTTAQAQRFAIKGYDNIGLGKSMSIDEAQPGQSAKSNFNSFGLDFGYTFWRKGAQSLEANIGIGYSMASATFSIPEMKYHYSAPAYADMDGNPYERYYELSALRQKASVGYINIPIYLEYQYKPLRWLGLHAEVGVGLGFACNHSVGGVSGSVYSYGVFPEYDDLLIDAEYLDDFGHRYLGGASVGKGETKGFAASVMCGAGFEFYAYEPVSFVVGVRYNAGLTQVFNGKYDITSANEYTAETAPVTYTVAEGTQVKALTDYSTKSRLSPLSLHVGINVRF